MAAQSLKRQISIDLRHVPNGLPIIPRVHCPVCRLVMTFWSGPWIFSGDPGGRSSCGSVPCDIICDKRGLKPNYSLITRTCLKRVVRTTIRIFLPGITCAGMRVTPGRPAWIHPGSVLQPCRPVRNIRANQSPWVTTCLEPGFERSWIFPALKPCRQPLTG